MRESRGRAGSPTAGQAGSPPHERRQGQAQLRRAGRPPRAGPATSARPIGTGERPGGRARPAGAVLRRGRPCRRRRSGHRRRPRGCARQAVGLGVPAPVTTMVPAGRRERRRKAGGRRNRSPRDPASHDPRAVAWRGGPVRAGFAILPSSGAELDGAVLLLPHGLAAPTMTTSASERRGRGTAPGSAAADRNPTPGRRSRPSRPGRRPCWPVPSSGPSGVRSGSTAGRVAWRGRRGRAGGAGAGRNLHLASGRLRWRN